MSTWYLIFFIYCCFYLILCSNGIALLQGGWGGGRVLPCISYIMVTLMVIVTLFIHSISFRYIYIQVQKTNSLTKLESKIKTKIIKMKRKHLLFREAVCKNNMSLIQTISQSKLRSLIFLVLK